MEDLVGAYSNQPQTHADGRRRNKFTWYQLSWRRKKSHLRRCSGFSASQYTTCIILNLKNHYALYMEFLLSHPGDFLRVH
ncbi:MAG: hypothetical protein PF482_01875, partial [Desulfobacteraceae bacterium]|nr:hypothetical protein [Desulfobacteraceae bacterium]